MAALKKLKKVEHKLVGSRKESKDENERYYTLKREFEVLKEELDTATLQTNEWIYEKECLENKFVAATKRYSHLKFSYQRTQERIAEFELKRKKIEQEVNRLEVAGANVLSSLAILNSEYNEEAAEEQAISEKVRMMEEEYRHFYMMKAVNMSSYTKEQRDSQILESISNFRQNMEKMSMKESDIIARIEALADNVEKEENVHESLKEEHEQALDLFTEYSSEIKQLEEKHAQTLDYKRELSRKDDTTSCLLRNYHSRRRNLERNMFAADYNAYYHVQDILQEWTSQDHAVELQYHGIVIERFTCPPSLTTAVEAVANKKLLTYIVETDIFATELTKRFNSKKLRGTLNFVALNKILLPNINYSNIDRQITRPLMDFIVCEEKYQPVMQLLFGRTLVCQKEEECAQLAKLYKFNIVTLEGTTANPRGVLRGGYYESRKLKLSLQLERKDLQQLEKEADTKLKHYKTQYEKVEEESWTIVNQLMKLNHKMGNLKNVIPSLQSNIDLQSKNIQRLQNSLNFYRESLARLQSEKASTIRKISLLQKAIDDDLQSEITDAEAENRKLIFEELMQLKRKLGTLAEKKLKRDGLQASLISLEMLRKELVELEQNPAQKEEAQKASALQKTIADTYTEMKELEKRIAEADDKCLSMKLVVQRLESIIKEKQDEIDKSKVRFVEDAKQEKYFSKVIQKKKDVDHIGAMISSLESLSVKYTNEYATKSYHQLQDCQRQLESDPTYHREANAKAGIRLQELNDHLKFIEREMDSLKQNEMVTQELMEASLHWTEDGKNMALKTLSMGFTHIFQQFVPNGHGNIVFYIDNDTSSSSTENGTESGTNNLLSIYKGVDFNVSFRSDSPRRQTLDELSGGQKSLVALAFILALHECDDVPFFLFDEVDANLDERSRNALAEHIKSYVNTQFIVSTFRPQLLRSADKCISVTCPNLVSYVKSISVEDAYAIISDASIRTRT